MPGPDDKNEQKLSAKMGGSLNKEAMKLANQAAQQAGMRRASAMSLAAQLHHGLGDAEAMISDSKKILDYIEGKD